MAKLVRIPSDRNRRRQPSLAKPDADPRLWLEEIEGDCALAWVKRENARTLAAFADRAFERDRDALAAIMERPDNIPYVGRRGGLLYNRWTDAKNPRGLWRRTTAATYASEAPDWDVLIDLDKLAADEGEDWIWGGASTLLPDHDRALVRLSRGGSDASVVREFDMTTRRFVADGFVMPEAKGGLTWLDRDTVILSAALGEGHATTSGYARTVRLWRRGTPWTEATVIFETEATHMSCWGSVDHDVSPPRLVFGDKPGFFDARLWFGDRTGPKQRLDLPTDAWFWWHGGALMVKPRTPWTVAGETHAPDTLLGLSLDDVLAGRPKPIVLFTPGPRSSLDGFFPTGDTFVLTISEDLRTRIEIVRPADGWSRARVDGVPETADVSVWSADSDETESNGDVFLNIQDPLSPPVLRLRAADGKTSTLKRGPRAFDAHGMVVARHEAVSSDGERIPYVQVGPAETSGDAPVLMSGYGGFGIAMKPGYRAGIGKLWLEGGGTFVLAHLRGGGEFGTRWHEAGRREGKWLSHEDFAAIARDLVRRGVTTAKRIAAEGGSNGGILISNMLTRHPDAFGALFCTIPLIDMRRYPKLLAGASWIAEYGDPDKAEDWAFLQKISAYHTVAPPGPDAPAILVATTRKDDRVHPGHARKFAAKLQALGYDAWFHEPAAGGHGYGKDARERAAFTALGYRFLRQKIGWEG